MCAHGFEHLRLFPGRHRHPPQTIHLITDGLEVVHESSIRGLARPFPTPGGDLNRCSLADRHLPYLSIAVEIHPFAVSGPGARTCIYPIRIHASWSSTVR